MFRSQEQRYFSEVLSKHLKSADAPLLLEGGVGLGKTRAYLAALAWGRRAPIWRRWPARVIPLPWYCPRIS